ncbi:MAG: hypothetical protein ACO34J_14565, partial [Prochlorothrix sp.]
QEQERRRVLLEMLDLELEFKFGEQGRALLPYVVAVEWTEDLHSMVRSIKPLSDWEAVKSWSLEHLGEIGSNSGSLDRPQQWLGLVLKLAFPGESASAIAQTQTQLAAIVNPAVITPDPQPTPPRPTWETLAQRIAVAQCLEELAG